MIEQRFEKCGMRSTKSAGDNRKYSRKIERIDPMNILKMKYTVITKIAY